jgi:hypothetical protein
MSKFSQRGLLLAIHDELAATPPTFDSVFANDPLADQYRALGTEAKAVVDPANAAPRYVALGALCDAIMAAERKRDPENYSRPAVIQKCAQALELCDVPESLVRPNEMIAAYWLAKLDRSNPGPRCEPRSFASSDVSADWFGGRITFGAIRVLARCIDRVSGQNELDTYEFKPGHEASCREWIIRLRNGQLSVRQVTALVKTHRKAVKYNLRSDKYRGLSADEIASIEAGIRGPRARKRDARMSFPSPSEMAARLTPADAKAMVQSLVKLPDRLAVFETLFATCKAFAAQLKASRDSVATEAAHGSRERGAKHRHFLVPKDEFDTREKNPGGIFIIDPSRHQSWDPAREVAS